MAIDDPKQKKLEKLLALMEPDAFTTKDFVASFTRVLNFAKALREANSEQIAQMQKTLIAVINKAKSDVDITLVDFKQRAETLFMETRMKAVEDSLKQHKEDIANDVEDFKGDVMSEVADVKFELDTHKGDIAEQLKVLGDIPAQATAIAEEINSRPKVFELDAIKGLVEIIDELRKELKTVRGMTGSYAGGFAGAGRGLVKAYDLSSKLDGSTKTFSLPAFWRVISIHSSSAPGVFEPLTDYSVDGTNMQITFGATITAAATLAAGQTLLVVYAET